MRNTKPEPIQKIIAKTMKEIKSNISYYTPEIHRETAAGRIRQPLDLKTGDTVQILGNAKNNIGRIGVILGIKYTRFENKRDGFLYTVRFSDNESAIYIADQLTFLRGADG